MNMAALLVDLAGWWLMLGAAVAALFLTIGIDRIDEDSRGAYAFRPLLIPGVLLIWPLVLWRWVRVELDAAPWAARYRPPRAVHLPVALILAAAVAFAVIAGFSVRQTWPVDVAPVKLSEAEK